MEPITRISGTMAPLPRPHVDTDQIIPKQFLKRIERTGFGRFLFHDWAFDGEGEPRPDWVLNRPEYARATVLVGGPDFGTGSSREHAPWALADWGFAAVIAPSFGDIFRSNCYKIGLLAVELPHAIVSHLQALAARDPGSPVTIDLVAQRVTAEGVDAPFSIDSFVRNMLMHGLDEIALTLKNTKAIEAYEAARPGFKPAVQR